MSPWQVYFYVAIMTNYIKDNKKTGYISHNTLTSNAYGLSINKTKWNEILHCQKSRRTGEKSIPLTYTISVILPIKYYASYFAFFRTNI